MAPPVQLSPRQEQVARLVREGFTLEEIAEQLGIKRRTAEGHAAELRRKTGERSTRRAASRARGRGARTERDD